jgi:hypothetical protein
MKPNRLWIATLLQIAAAMGCGQISNTSGTDSSARMVNDGYENEPVQGQNRHPRKSPETLAEAVDVIKYLAGISL